MNITLWECYYTQEEPVEGGSASVQYHLLSPNHFTGVPSNPSPYLIKPENPTGLFPMVALPMAVGGKEIRFNLRDRQPGENWLTSNTWVVQTNIDLIEGTPQEILDDLTEIWITRRLAADYRLHPFSARSVGEWMETLEFDYRKMPARWISPNGTVVVSADNVASTTQDIQQVTRDCLSSAAVLVQAIPLGNG